MAPPLEEEPELLRFMNEQFVKLCYKRSEPPKAEDLVDQLKANWTGNPADLSARIARAMATIMRPLDFKKGGARKQRSR